MSRSKRSHGEGTIRKRGKNWLFELCIDGKRHNGSCKIAEHPSRREANQVFNNWKIQLSARAAAEAAGILTWNDLFDKYLKRQRLNDREQAYNVEKMTTRYLRPYWGRKVAADSIPADVEDYIDWRREQPTYKGTPPANATINRELSTLVSASVLHTPHPVDLKIQKLDESAGVRQGLVTRQDYDALLYELEPYQKPVWCTAFHTGVRQGELLKLERDWVDWHSRMIDVPGRTSDRKRVTKNAQGHYIPLYTQALYDLVRWAYDTGNPECKYLFQREGKPISKHTFHQSMKRACGRAKLTSLLFHDTRRTAVTMMIEFGFTPEEAMSISNHRDPSILKRYDILSPAKQKQRILRLMPRLAAMHEKNILGTDYGRITDGAEAALETDSGDGPKVN